MPYLGNTPTTQNFISGTDYFNGTGSQTAFTLTRTVNSVNDIQVVVNNVVQQPNDAYTLSGTTLTMTSAPSAGTNNVYVRYLSTTTQVITPSQNTVSWNTLDTNTQNDLGLMYKNKIINGNMVIDQRNAGASVTPTSSATAYATDRWALNVSQNSKFSAQQSTGFVGFSNSLLITSLSAYSVTSGDYFMVDQNIEGLNVSDLGWGTANAQPVTLSFKVKSSLTGTFGGVISNSANNRSYPFSYTISAANTETSISITIAGDTSGTWLTTNGVGIRVRFSMGVGTTYQGTAGAWAGATYLTATGATSVVGTNGATWYLTGVQLEVGTQATAFSTAGGSYGAELALCQRYYYRITASGTSFSMFGPSWNESTTRATGQVKFPVTMRTRPTALEQSGTASNYAILHTNTSSSCSAVPAYEVYTNTDNGVCFFTVASGLTAGQGSTLASNINIATAYLAWSAEL